MNNKFIIALLALLLAAPAAAQTGSSVKQSGNVTPGHPAAWTTNGIIQDGGTAAIPYLTSLGVLASGPGICQSSAAITGPYNQLCFAPTSSGGGFTWTSFGGATGVPSFTINGVVYPFPFSSSGVIGPATTVVGDLVAWGNTLGTLTTDLGIGVGLTTSANKLILANPSATTLGGIESIVAATHEWIDSISTAGVPHQSQPAFTDISGVASAAQLPNPTASSLGGVESYAAVTHQWINAISTSGVPASTQPAFTDISGTVPNSQLATATANTMKGNWTSGTAAPSDNAMPSCADAGGSHLNYVNGTGVTCGTSGGAMILLNTLTASNSASLSDTSSLTATYPAYEIRFENIIPQTANTPLQLLIHENGTFPASSYIANITYYDTAFNISAVTTYIPLVTSAQSGSGPGYTGTITVAGPSNTAAPKLFEGTGGYNNTTPHGTPTTTTGYWNGGNNAVDGFELTYGGGVNIVSGIIKVYGIQ